MTKKEYTIVASIIFALIGLGIGSLVLGSIFQESGSTNVPTGVWVGLFFVFLVAAIILLLVNFKKLMKYEFERIYKKHENLETRKLQSVRLSLSEEQFDTIFEKYRHGKTPSGLYWIFRPNYMTQHMAFVLEFKSNEDMTEQEEEESKEDSEAKAEEEIDPKLEELLQHMPKASRQGFHARVVFNMLDSVDDELIAQAERIVTNSEIVSRTFGMFSPIILYFLYDKSTGTLYYEPYKRYKLYPRPKALKMLLKMLGVEIRQDESMEH